MEGDVDRLDHRHHPQRRHDLLQLLDGAGSGGHSAVGDEADGLVAPLLVQVVDGVLQRRRVAVVVLRRDEHHGVRTVDDRAPRLGVRLRVLPEPGVVRLVEQRQRDLGEIDDLDIEAAVAASKIGEPLGDGQSGATRAGRADDDGETGHGRAPPGRCLRQQLSFPERALLTRHSSRSGPPADRPLIGSVVAGQARAAAYLSGSASKACLQLAAQK